MRRRASVQKPKFSLVVDDLSELMKRRGTVAVKHLNDEYPDGIIGLCTKLKSSPNGLSGDPEDIAMRQKAFGKNVIPPKPMKSFFILMFEAVQDMTLIVLIVAAVISMLLSLYQPPPPPVDDLGEEGEPKKDSSLIEGCAILLAVVVVVLVTAINDWKKEKQFRGLKTKIDDSHIINVFRNGEMQQIVVSDLVVGDISLIKYGDMLPADGIIVQSNDLAIDESTLTGESAQVSKGVNVDPMLYSGTHVMEGSGRMLVTAVGLNSQAGIILSLLGRADHGGGDVKKKSVYLADDMEVTGKEQIQEKMSMAESKEKSVLQAKLTRLAIKIGYIGTLVAILTVIILSARFSVRTFVIEGNTWHSHYVQNYLQFFIIGITVLVVAVPEGLPLAVTIALAYSVRRMMKDSNLVRHLDACETMGNATTICSDKTGTLTTNRMTVVRSYVGGDMRYFAPTDLPVHVKELISQSICINSGYTSKIIPGAKKGELPNQVGNKTECALLGYIQNLGFDYEEIRREFPESEFVKVYTFNSKRKSMSTVIALKDRNGYRVFTKGASEILLHKCKYIMGHEGKIIEISKDRLEDLMAIVTKMSKDGMRTLLIAYKDMVPSPKDFNEDQLRGTPDWTREDMVLSNLTCLAILGIEDPVRPEVPESIRMCQAAGITVRMVTGDNIETARSIAIKCGIISSNNQYHLVLEADEFNRLIRRTPTSKNVDPELFDKVWPRLRVLARSSPRDKYVLVKGIIESKLHPHREVVAVTGDGTNDGPALKIADVGFAMGIAGTDVAKEASDIILMDDNFASIVKAVMWGRSVYDNISKFLQFQLTVNVVAVVVAFMGACFVNETPLKAIQMLWVNLIMDTLASLALATELPTTDLLKRKPYGRTQPLISASMMKYIIGHSAYQLTIIFFIIIRGADWLDIDSSLDWTPESSSNPGEHFTIVFNAFVLMTLFNELNSRKLYSYRNVFSGIFKNYIFIAIWVTTMVIQVVIIQYGGKAFHVAPLDLEQWMWCLLFGFGSLLWGQVVMSIPDGTIPKSLGIIEVTQAEVNALKNEDYLLESQRQKAGRILWVRSITRIQKQLQMEYIIRQIQNQNTVGIREPV